MHRLWEEIGFKPSSFILDEEDTEEYDAIEIRDKKGFTPPMKVRPPMSEEDQRNMTGVSIRNLPLDIESETLQTFLESAGLPLEHTDISTQWMFKV